MATKYKYKYASASERRFAEMMDSRGIRYEYEPISLAWSPPEKRYIPDFEVTLKDGSTFLIEYKGFLRASDRIKLLSIKKQYPDLDLRLVFANARNRLSARSKTTYAQWAGKHGFPWAEKTIPDEWIRGKEKK